MVGSGAASYTGIIEQGIEQQQGPKPMTTKQNDTVAVADALLDGVSGGALTVFTNIASFTSPRGDDYFSRGLHNNGAVPPVTRRKSGRVVCRASAGPCD